MKIYNEIITRFNDLTGKWETISEDSYNYSGPVDMAQGGLPPNSVAINASDTITDTIKTTAGYFTNGDGTLSGAECHSGSLADSNEKYYFNVNNLVATNAQTETQFSVTFGHAEGSGSDTFGDSSTNPSTLKGETQAIYKQLANLLMEETEASGGFKISAHAGSAAGNKGYGSGAALAAGARDDYVYALIGKRSRFKDRMNKQSWTLTLSGSTSTGTGRTLTLTDDSKTVAAVATPGGPRYNIISGTLGNAATGEGYTTNTYGWFYPEMGIMVFSGPELSQSMPGAVEGPAGAGWTTTTTTVSMSYNGTVNAAGNITSSGFAPILHAHANAKNALKFLHCLRENNTNTALRLRSEEDQTQENYFCRIKADQFNFSSNPTFVSGSKNKLRNTDMAGNPQTFITGVGLYNSGGQLLAIAKLSSPLKKNFASEATVKVKLTY